jgi:hypothetical protein
MSDFSLTLVLQIKTSKIINDMAKVQQKSEKISAFGGIFFVLDIFQSNVVIWSWSFWSKSISETRSLLTIYK